MLGRLITYIGLFVLIIGLSMGDSDDLVYPFAFILAGALIIALGKTLEVDE